MVDGRASESRTDPWKPIGNGRWVGSDASERFPVYTRGKAGEVYNFGADCEWRNLDLVKALLRLVGRPEDLITFVTDRPGHDLRYAIDSSKSRRELGWSPKWPFEEGLRQTVAWYVDRSGSHG